MGIKKTGRLTGFFLFRLVIVLFRKLRIVLQKPFGYLDRIQGSSLFDLVANAPEGNSVRVGDVFTDTANVHIILA